MGVGSWGVRRTLAGAILVFGLTGLAPRDAAAADPSFLTFSGGYFDVIHHGDSAAVGGVEWMSSWRMLWILQPMIGGMATTDGGVYGYAGFGTDIFFGNRWVLTPSVAVGAFDEGGGKDLGNTVEFRTAVTFAYRFDDRSRLGLRFYHMSNAGLSDTNPGVEVLDLTYSIPLH